MTADHFDYLGSGDSFSFNHSLYGGGLPGIGESHTPEVTLGVNFDSQLASHSDAGDGWFVYHTDTGNLHWDPDGSGAHGATTVPASTNHFALTSGHFIFDV